MCHGQSWNESRSGGTVVEVDTVVGTERLRDVTESSSPAASGSTSTVGVLLLYFAFEGSIVSQTSHGGL